MIRGFYTAGNGLRAYQEQMNVTSNNMANVNTVAYKSMRTSFSDLMYQNLNRPEAANQAMVGHGIKITKTDVNVNQAGLTPTDRAMDVALLETGCYFMVQTPGGEIRYTRAGNFSLSNDDDDFYLVDFMGNRVLNEDEEPIEIEFDETNNINMDFLEEIGVAKFPNPYALVLVGNNTYIATEEAGEMEILEEPEMKNGYLEASGVDVSTEMVGVIEASKAFSFASRMIQVADEVEQVVNSLR